MLKSRTVRGVATFWKNLSYLLDLLYLAEQFKIFLVQNMILFSAILYAARSDRIVRLYETPPPPT